MITSSANPAIKEARRLATRKGRYAAGQVFVEGVRLATDIWRSGALPERLFYAPDLLSPEGRQLLADWRQQVVGLWPAPQLSLPASAKPPPRKASAPSGHCPSFPGLPSPACF